MTLKKGGWWEAGDCGVIKEMWHGTGVMKKPYKWMQRPFSVAWWNKSFSKQFVVKKVVYDFVMGFFFIRDPNAIFTDHQCQCPGPPVYLCLCSMCLYLEHAGAVETTFSFLGLRHRCVCCRLHGNENQAGRKNPSRHYLPPIRSPRTVG